MIDTTVLRAVEQYAREGLTPFLATNYLNLNYEQS
jgi:hypothetical protein